LIDSQELPLKVKLTNAPLLSQLALSTVSHTHMVSHKLPSLYFCSLNSFGLPKQTVSLANKNKLILYESN